MRFRSERRAMFLAYAKDRRAILASAPMILLFSLVLAGCTFPQRPLPVQAAQFDTCSPEIVEQYFNAYPLQSVLFERNAMGAFLGQFRVCEHEFVLTVPNVAKRDGRTLSIDRQ